MFITDVQVRDVVFQIEFTLEEVKSLKKALENTTLELSLITDPVEKENVTSALNGLYEVFKGAVNGAEDEE
jgi:hypothetical protein